MSAASGDPGQPASVIDAHHHLWDPKPGQYPWMVGDFAALRRRFGPDDLEPLLHAAGVTATIVVQARSDLDETCELLGAAEASSFIAGVVGWMDLTGDVPGQLARLGQTAELDTLVGVRHQVHDEADAEWLVRPDVLRGLAAVAEAGLVYDLLVRTRELPAALAASRQLPHLHMVIDHLAKPPVASGEVDTWRARLEPFGVLPNVDVKLSGMVTEADWDGWRPADLLPYVETVLDLFGEDRAMFGSDWPVCLLASDYLEVKATLERLLTDLGVKADSPVWGATAAATYGLGATQPAEG